MRTEERRILALLGGLAAVLCSVVLLSMRGSTTGEAGPVIVAAGSSAVLGGRQDFLGNPACPFTLVEFADYQCPACGATNRILRSVLARHAGVVKLAFRNLPLTMHSRARPAALAAECARLQGQFWPMHDALFEHASDLSDTRIAQIARNLHLDPARFEQDRNSAAKQAVEQDIRDARVLRVSATPTFYLCCPSGRTYRLSSLGDLDRLLRAER